MRMFFVAVMLASFAAVSFATAAASAFVIAVAIPLFSVKNASLYVRLPVAAASIIFASDSSNNVAESTFVTADNSTVDVASISCAAIKSAFAVAAAAFAAMISSCVTAKA